MSAAYSQANRPLRVTTPLGPNVLLVRSLAGTEGLSELFSFRLELVADKYVKIPFDRLLGQSVTIEIAHPTGAVRTINGIVNRFSQGDRDEVFATYEAEVVPQLWLLTRRTNSRIFQQLSVPEILAQVLTGTKYTPELSGTYEPRDFCVQYHESDFAFISRLMEEEGIAYFFRHSADSHELVLTDATANLPAVEGNADVTYEEVRGAVKDNMRITAWKKSQQICSNKFTLWDHEFELPGKNLEASDSLPATLQVGKVTHKVPGTDKKLEAYAYPGEFAKRFDGIDPGGGDRAGDLANIFASNKRTASVRMQAGLSEVLTIAGTSNCVNFLPGAKFTLQRHFDGDGNYLLTRVEHSVKLPNVYRSGGDSDQIEYENRFACVPAEVAWRPQRATPRPQIIGTQTATVVGPAGEQIFCDKYGRIKVQFHWDREGKNDSSSSCWIRVGQIWAGKRWGALFVPRIGHEVIVSFEDGDPDQPIVIGSVYNAANMPPFVLPDQKLVAGIKSCSVNGEPSKNFNGIVFHDELGNEHVQIHSERAEIHNSESARRERTGSTHVRIVGSLFSSPVGSGSGGGCFGGLFEANPAVVSCDELFGDGPIEDDAPVVDSPPGENLSSGSGGGDFFTNVGDYFKSNWTQDYTGSYQVTIGNNSTSVLGFPMGTTNSASFGGDISLVVDPYGLCNELMGNPSKSYPWGWLAGDLLLGLGGYAELTLGRYTNIVYGVSRDIHRGTRVQLHSDINAPGATAAKTIAGLLTATSLTASILAEIYPDDTAWENSVAQWGLGGISNRLMALLTAVEHAPALASMATDRLQQAADMAAAADNQFATLKPALLQTAQQNADQAILLATQAAAQAHDAPPNQNIQVAGDSFLRATNIEMRAQPANDELGPSHITLNAVGGAQNGSINLMGSLQGSLAAGPASVQVTRAAEVGTVIVDAGELGTVNLKQGLIDTGARIKLEPNSAQLAVGLPDAGSAVNLRLNEIVLSSGPAEGGAQIALGMNGIRLQFGEWMITLNADGIALVVGDNSIMLTPEGITNEAVNIENSAELVATLSGTNLVMQGEADAMLTSPMISLGP